MQPNLSSAVDLPDILPDEAIADLALERIHPQPGFNIRTYFDPQEIERLADSLKRDGQAQNIVVRPDFDRPGDYLLIAGERRWRAAKAAGLSALRALVRHADDLAAMRLNAIENLAREGVSPAEEAQSVRRMVDACGGDRDEAARQLGLSRRTVDARLLLLNATEAVLTALAARQIKLGHAEILAGLPKATQEGTLAKILENKASVEELRARVDAFAYKLAAAIFETEGCAQCPHNSSTQASLFDACIGDGRCLDRECWSRKREGRIGEMRAEHQKTYPVVWLDTEKDPTSYILLVKTGPQGVGAEQYRACLNCSSYGCLMRTAPGEEGQVQMDVCFDVPCNKEKVRTYQESLASETPEAAESDEKGATSVKAGEKGKSAPAKTRGKGKSSPAAKGTPRKVEEMHYRFYLDTACEAIRAHPRMGLVFAAFSLLAEITESSRELFKQYNLTPANFRESARDKGIADLAGLEGEKLKALVVDSASALVREGDTAWLGKETPVDVRTAKRVLGLCASDLAGHFKVTKDYLAAHTKSGLESLLSESGFDAWYNDQKKDPKAFGRLLSGKHDEIVKAVLKSGYAFERFVPRSVQLS